MAAEERLPTPRPCMSSSSSNGAAVGLAPVLPSLALTSHRYFVGPTRFLAGCWDPSKTLAASITPSDDDFELPPPLALEDGSPFKRVGCRGIPSLPNGQADAFDLHVCDFLGPDGLRRLNYLAAHKYQRLNGRQFAASPLCPQPRQPSVEGNAAHRLLATSPDAVYHLAPPLFYVETGRFQDGTRWALKKQGWAQLFWCQRGMKCRAEFDMVAMYSRVLEFVWIKNRANFPYLDVVFQPTPDRLASQCCFSHIPTEFELTKKDRLAANTARYARFLNSHGMYFEFHSLSFPVHPETFRLKEWKECQRFIATIKRRQHAWRKICRKQGLPDDAVDPQNVWIVKPSKGSCGRGISVHSDVAKFLANYKRLKSEGIFTPIATPPTPPPRRQRRQRRRLQRLEKLAKDDDDDDDDNDDDDDRGDKKRTNHNNNDDNDDDDDENKKQNDNDDDDDTTTTTTNTDAAGSNAVAASAAAAVEDDAPSNGGGVVSDGADNFLLTSRIAQRYISHPLLIEGRKFDVRSYMYIVDVADQVLYYHDGYIRKNAEPYDEQLTELSNRFIHLSNVSVQKKHPDFAVIQEEMRWRYDRFQAYLTEHRLAPDDWVDKTFRPTMKLLMWFAFKSAWHRMNKTSGFYAMVGADFIVDRDLNIQLIEFSKTPAVHKSKTGDFTQRYSELIQQAVEMHVELRRRQIHGESFGPGNPLNLLSARTWEPCRPQLQASSFADAMPDKAYDD